ncbi:MAG: hypothetical protein Q9219_005603 [cf. Caloplaca sp. 3 TL-2023]
MDKDKRIKELEAQLELANLRAEDSERERQISDRERQKAEKERQKAEEESQKAEEERRRAEKENQESTLKEFLSACYHQIDSRFVVEADREKCTKDTVTSPAGRSCPNRLLLWHDFPRLQASAFQEVVEFFHPTNAEARRELSSASYIAGVGAHWGRGTIASEGDLKAFQNGRVEEFVAEILTIFKGRKSSFANQSNILGKDSDGKAKGPAFTDQICVVDLDGVAEFFLILEYKAPHKLTTAHLRASVQGLPDIDVEPIRNPDQVYLSDTDEFFKKARYLLAASTCQTYNYMIGSGCPYGCIVTGEAVLFLKVDEAHPTDLHYFLAEPRLDVTNANQEIDISKTMVAQLLSFCLMALPPQKFNEEWIRRAKETAPQWIINDKDVVYETPEKLRLLEERMETVDLDYKGYGGPHIARSPYPTRLRNKAKSSGACATEAMASTRASEESDSSSDYDHSYETPSKSGPSKKHYQTEQKDTSKQSVKTQPNSGSSKHKSQQRQYCTQACLFGLVHRLPVDDACPNAASHPRSAKGKTHALTRPRLAKLLQEQLLRTMDEGCDNLRLQGSRGMLFRLSLDPHGYTLVGKGTIRLYRRDLKREGRMYRRLNQFQGRSIPVYLGNIDLDIPWYGLCTEIIHMLLLSFGGQALKDYPTQEQDAQAKAFEKALAAQGVRHRDMRFPNMLWNEELQRLIFIDFERAVRIPIVKEPQSVAKSIQSRPSIAPPKRRALQEIAPSHGKLNRLPKNSQRFGLAEKKTSMTIKKAALSLVQEGMVATMLAECGTKNQTLDQPKLQCSDDLLALASFVETESGNHLENFTALLPYADEFN